jgi:putative phosphoribosyl transferase
MDAKLVYFANRCDAGRRLAARLSDKRSEQPVVLGLARGGVPVAYEVARELEATLDVMVTRKIGAPRQRELAIGAVAPEATFLAEHTIHMLGVPNEYVEEAVRHERTEVRERSKRYRAGLAATSLENRPVILVDDGIATGATMFAAIESARNHGAARIIVAAPVCAAQTVPQIRELADELLFLETPENFIAVGVWYQDFSPTDDNEVVAVLKRAHLEREAHHHAIGQG